MPITKSAKKALRQNAKKRISNIIYLEKMKKLIKEIRALILAKKSEEAKKLLPEVFKVLDKSAKENVIKKNTASRNKSRLSRAVSNLGNK